MQNLGAESMSNIIKFPGVFHKRKRPPKSKPEPKIVVCQSFKEKVLAQYRESQAAIKAKKDE